MDQSWRDPDAAWWAKAARARKHIDEFSFMVAEFEKSRPYEVQQEETSEVSEVAYRFRVRQEVPAGLLTAVGDAIHNMRSSLDSVAYELARQYLNGEMTPKQQGVTQFPICETGEDFDDFFAKNKHRREMYGEQQKEALRCVQPFALQEEASTHGVDFETDPHLEYITDELHRLHTLSNVDKHRRLPLLSWYLDINYWDDPECSWRFARHPHAAFEDKTLIGYLSTPRVEAPTAQVTFDFRLSLVDDPGYRQDLISVLARWHEYLTSWVLPRIFIVAEGNPPPMFIGRLR
jgi:hypothetical protein